jgi:rhomboid protease GluP
MENAALDAPGEGSLAVPPATLPWATGALIAALLLAFLAELAWGVRPWSGLLQPALETLVAFGGLAWPLIEEGQWYRLLTAAFLHADAVHLALNLVAIGLAGMLLENLLGRLWLLAVFVLGALGGSLLSLAWNSPNVVSVGASGAILALLTAAFASSFRLPAGAPRTRIHLLMLQLLLPSLLPLAWHRGGESVDVASHLGGAVTGALCGWFLLRTWRADEPLPRFRGAALATVLAGAVLLAFGLASAPGARAQSLRLESYASLLIPEAELPATEEQLLDAAAGLVERYPRDPRSRWFLGVRLARAGELSAAEAELRTALAETEILAAYFDDRELEITLRSLLATILLELAQPEQARLAAAPVCGAGAAGKVPESLESLDVCP